MQIHALRALRDERAQRQRAAGPVDDALRRHVGQDNGPRGPPAFLARPARLIDGDFGYRRRLGERRLQLCVEIGGFGIHRVGGEQGVVYHVAGPFY